MLLARRPRDLEAVARAGALGERRCRAAVRGMGRNPERAVQQPGWEASSDLARACLPRLLTRPVPGPRVGGRERTVPCHRRASRRSGCRGARPPTRGCRGGCRGARPPARGCRGAATSDARVQRWVQRCATSGARLRVGAEVRDLRREVESLRTELGKGRSQIEERERMLQEALSSVRLRDYELAVGPDDLTGEQIVQVIRTLEDRVAELGSMLRDRCLRGVRVSRTGDRRSSRIPRRPAIGEAGRLPNAERRLVSLRRRGQGDRRLVVRGRRRQARARGLSCPRDRGRRTARGRASREFRAGCRRRG